VPKIPDDSCSIARSLGVLGERWTFLVLRDAFEGLSRFVEFRESLGIAPDILSDRLSTLVEYGVLRKVDYQEPGERRRAAYELTDAGRELYVVLAGLQQWGDKHLPWADGPSLLRRDAATGEPVHVGFIDSQGREIDPDRVTFVPTESYPRGRLAARNRRRAPSAPTDGR
jgi:DNA-binding HxlR family transcriptional regulator